MVARRREGVLAAHRAHGGRSACPSRVPPQPRRDGSLSSSGLGHQFEHRSGVDGLTGYATINADDEETNSTSQLPTNSAP